MNKIIIVLALLAMLLGYLTAAKEAKSETLPNIQVYAFQKVLEKWNDEQWASFDNIIDKESQYWTITGAHYPSGYTKSGVKSSAYGLGGFLDATWDDVGCIKTKDSYIQIDCAIEYISLRYGTPDKAWDHHRRESWY